MAIARFLKQLVPSAPYPVPDRPEAPLCVIGDVHGCSDLLLSMLSRLADLPGAEKMRVIFPGDMIDRGANSAAVLKTLRQLTVQPAPFASVLCLKGNHEQMMLNFIGDPLSHGPRWLSNGGDKTLESFGLSANRPLKRPGPVTDIAPAHTRLETLRDTLLQALPIGMLDWITQLPLYWHEHDLAVTHAGANPDLPLELQTEKDLLWGHRAFRSRRRTDGLWIAHGHYIVSEPTASAGRISVDTGAYHSGRLNAVILNAVGLQFIEVVRNSEANELNQSQIISDDL